MDLMNIPKSKIVVQIKLVGLELGIPRVPLISPIFGPDSSLSITTDFHNFLTCHNDQLGLFLTFAG